MSHNQEQEWFARAFSGHLLTAVPDMTGGTHIPRRLIQFWDKEPPEDVGRMLALSKTWAEKHQIDYVLFNEEDVRRFLEDREVDGKPLLDLFDRCFHPAMKADLFRLVYLHEFGGYYLDADNGVTDDALQIFELDRDIFFFDRTQRRVQNNFLAVAPGSILIGNVLSAAAANIMEKASEDVGIGILTGPYVFTVELAKLLPEGGYSCYLVDYLKNLKLAPGPEAVLGEALGYKSSDQNWQRAQAGPIMARLRESLGSGEPRISDFRELCRIALKFGLELEEAEAIAAANWTEWTRHPICIILRSRLLIRLGRFAEARALLEGAYDRFIRPPALLKLLSGLNMKPGQLDTAERLARLALEKAPDDPDAHAQLAATLKGQKRFAEAKAIVDHARQRFPANPRLQTLAAKLEGARSLEDEIVAMTRSLDAPETDGRDRFLSIGRTCLHLGLYLEEVERLAAAWWDNWHNIPRCVWIRARILEKLDRVDAAKALVEEGYEKKLRSTEILAMLARLSLDAGETDFAEDLARQAVGKAPGRVDVRIIWAKSLLAQGALAEAAAVRQFLQDQHPKHPLVVAFEQDLAGDTAWG